MTNAPHLPQASPDDDAQPAGGAFRARWLGILVVLVGVAGLHAFVIANEPTPTLFEDEPHYAEYAFADAAGGETSLLPGHLRFDQRPELISRLWANLVRTTDLEPLRRVEWPARVSFEDRVRVVGLRDEGALLQRRARWVNLGLLLALVLLTHAQARAIGLGRRAALAAALGLGVFPWFGFYVHTLWAELLHAALVGVTFLGVFVHLSSRRRWPLVPAGLALGVALLAKGTMNPFLPVLAGVLFGSEWLRTRGRPTAARLGRALVAPALLLASMLIVVVPQLLANQRDGHGLRIAGNRWKNLEMGIVLEPRERQSDDERAERAHLHQLYMEAGETYEEREAFAEERTLAFVRERGFASVAVQQARKLALLLFDTPSFFERALDERWGDAAPGWLRALRLPGRALWTVLLLAGGTGAVCFFRRSPAFLVLALFTAYFAAAALVIPYKLRFLMPLVPVLALLAAAACESVARRAAQRGRAPRANR